jgi:hypothetical protein
MSADHREAAYWAAVRADADKLTLSPAQRDQLHVLLAPMRQVLSPTRGTRAA